MRLRPALLLTAVAGTALPGIAWTGSPPLATYVVTFAGPPSAVDLAMLGGIGGEPYGFTHVPAAVVRATPADLPLLRALPGVRGVYPNESYAPLMSTATATSRAAQAWNLGWTGAGVSVAVIDAGVDGTHPDLCAAPEFCLGTPVKVVQNVKVLGREDHVPQAGVVYLENQLNTDSTSGHGTHVAGIAAGNGAVSAGRYRGVAPGAGIVGYGTGEAVEAVNVLGAYDHAIAHRDAYGIRVINNSWGPGAFTDYDPDHPVNRATDAAWAAGISVVFGSGNDGTRTDSLNMFSAHPRAISVAGGRKDGHQAFFSSRGIPGSPLWRPTVMAPGENITSVRASTGFTIHAADAGAGYANPDAPPPDLAPYYASSSGTSMAAPHVSGVIALMQQASRAARGVWLTPAEVREILRNTARPMPAYQHHETGAGYVDALAAAQAAAAGTATQPWDDRTAYNVRPFSGSVSLGAGFEAAYEVLPGATSLSVMADWGPERVLVANQDVDVDLVRPDGTVYLGTFLRCDPAGQPNGYSSFCSSAPNERIVVTAPAPGIWKVRVGGLFAGSETVRGMWSAAYPDATAAPAPLVPATVTVDAPAAAVAGRPADLVATVRDAAGRPVPNAVVAWTSSGGAMTRRETYADSGGRVVATAESYAPGRQVVVASAGSVSGTAAVDWLGMSLPPVPPPPASTPGSVSGGGWFVQGGKRHLTAHAEYRAGASGPGGGFSYDDKAGTRVTAGVVERLAIDGARATITGPATVNGQTGYRYELTVVDGAPDGVMLVVTKPLWRYEAGGPLGGGNLQVRPG